MTNSIRLHQEGSLSWLTIDDGKANAVSHDIITALDNQIKAAASSPTCRGVVISGRPKFLSAGFDLATMNKDKESATELVEAGGKLMLELYKFPKPLIIASTGHAMAMGAILLFAADYRIGAQGDYKIGLNESAIGLALPWIAIHLAKEKLNPRYLDRIIGGAEIFSPDEAVELGFYDKVVSHDTLGGTVQREAIRLAELDAEAFTENKKRVRAETVAKLERHLTKNGGFWV